MFICCDHISSHLLNVLHSGLCWKSLSCQSLHGMVHAAMHKVMCVYKSLQKDHQAPCSSLTFEEFSHLYENLGLSWKMVWLCLYSYLKLRTFWEYFFARSGVSGNVPSTALWKVCIISLDCESHQRLEIQMHHFVCILLQNTQLCLIVLLPFFFPQNHPFSSLLPFQLSLLSYFALWSPVFPYGPCEVLGSFVQHWVFNSFMSEFNGCWVQASFYRAVVNQFCYLQVSLSLPTWSTL